MKVMMVNGSPHEKGCTYTALKEVANVLEQEGIETEIFWIGNQAIHGCIACKKCRETGECTFDDIVNAFARKAKDAEGFVFGAPVHYASAAGAMISFMDRLFYSTAGTDSNLFYLKPAAAIVSARRAGTTAAFDQINKYFTISQMPIVSSSYWNMVHGSRPEDVLQDAEGLQTMRNLAKNMVFLLKCRKAGEEAGIRYPQQEKSARTDFIR